MDAQTGAEMEEEVLGQMTYISLSLEVSKAEIRCTNPDDCFVLPVVFLILCIFFYLNLNPGPSCSKAD